MLSLPVVCRTATRVGIGAAIAAITCSTVSLGVAAAVPGDYAGLAVDPNLITDSQAYSAAPPVLDPNGQPGVSTVYTHRMNDRTITDTVLVLANDQAATDAANAARGDVARSTTTPVPVGMGGTKTVGTTADGTQSVALLTFTQGNAAAIITFTGPTRDVAPDDLVTEYGRKQDTAILDWQQS